MGLHTKKAPQPSIGAYVRAQVTPLINELGRTRLEVNVKVKAAFSKQLFALAVVVSIPVPDTTAKAELQTTVGVRGAPSVLPWAPPATAVSLHLCMRSLTPSPITRP